MQNTYVWRVIPSSQPAVIRSCPKCGSHSEYENSGNFRVNANQNHLDIWMIYQCKKCKSTWNMEILSRVNSNSIEKELYLKYLRNDLELSKQYAFDIAAHNRNKSILCFENVIYDIIGDSISLTDLKGNIQIELLCDYPLDIRLDKILSRQLGISREAVKRLGNSRNISVVGIKDIGKAKVKNGLLLNICIE